MLLMRIVVVVVVVVVVVCLLFVVVGSPPASVGSLDFKDARTSFSPLLPSQPTQHNTSAPSDDSLGVPSTPIEFSLYS